MDIYKSGQLKILLGCFPSAEGVRIKKFLFCFCFGDPADKLIVHQQYQSHLVHCIFPKGTRRIQWSFYEIRGSDRARDSESYHVWFL